MLKSYTKEQQEVLNNKAKLEYYNEYSCDLYGRFPWDCELRGRAAKGKTVNFSKASLGNFTYEVLKRGGNITSFWVFAPEYHRCSVFPRLWLTMDARDDMIKNGWAICSPPVAHLN